MRVLVVAYMLDRNDVGETLTAFKLLEQMSKNCEMTILAFDREGKVPLQEQLPNVRVVTWKEPVWLTKKERINAMLKPAMPVLSRHVRRWVKEAQKNGEEFDLAHFMLPRSPRFTVPLKGLGIPYLVGPVGGAIPNPDGFKSEMTTEKWYTRLREFDQLRFSYDPTFRSSYGQAEIVMGVAPYMKDVMSSVPMKRFEPFLGIGLEAVPPVVDREFVAGRMKMIHVGRGVRSKGLRDLVRALPHLEDMPEVTLSVVGDGDETQICRAEAEALGVADRVEFLGKMPRAEIDAHYRAADAFVFPSFRESMGGVLYEAMSWGLPVIGADAGGPGWIVDDSVGLKVPAVTPDQLTDDLVKAIRVMAGDAGMRKRMSVNARLKIEREALWPKKAERMFEIYQTVLKTI